MLKLVHSSDWVVLCCVVRCQCHALQSPSLKSQLTDNAADKVAQNTRPHFSHKNIESNRNCFTEQKWVKLSIGFNLIQFESIALRQIFFCYFCIHPWRESSQPHCIYNEAIRRTLTIQKPYVSMSFFYVVIVVGLSQPDPKHNNEMEKIASNSFNHSSFRSSKDHRRLLLLKTEMRL